MRRPFCFLVFELLADRVGEIELGTVPSKTLLFAKVQAKRQWPGQILEVRRRGLERDKKERYTYVVTGPAPSRCHLGEVMAANDKDALWLGSKKYPERHIEVESRLSHRVGGFGRPVTVR